MRAGGSWWLFKTVAQRVGVDVAQEWDRAAARLIAENAALRALLARGGVADVPADDGDLRVSALEAAAEALRFKLIDLHIAVEQRGVVRGDEERT